MNEEEITKAYYSNKNTTNFYLNLWGGDSIHIGIYPDNYTYNKDKSKENEVVYFIVHHKDMIYQYICCNCYHTWTNR